MNVKRRKVRDLPKIPESGMKTLAEGQAEGA